VRYCSYFFAAAFCFAHLLRCASAIFFLAEGERVLLFVVGAADEDAGGRPLRLAGEEPASALRACCRRAIWASIAVNISEVVIALLYQDSKVLDVLLKGYAPATFQAERLNLMTGNRMMWDGKVHRHTKFGHISIKGTVKEEERRRQIGRMRRRWAEQDARVRELREAEQEPQLRSPFRMMRVILRWVFRD